jgi:hypothetical protein
MNSQTLRDAIKKYRNRLKENCIDAEQCEGDIPCYGSYTAGKHCHWMLNRMEEMLTELESDDKGRWAKLMRWLGFVQGVLWAITLYTIDELKEDNRGSVEV